MSHASAFFRSHLMQQFAATARNQSRPPLALTTAISSNNGHSSITSPSPSEQQSSQQQSKLPSRPPSSSLMASPPSFIQSLNNNPSSALASPMDLPSSIQRAICHGISSTLSFLHLKHPHSHSSSFCSFKRLLTPSDATERLLSIRYHVAVASLSSSSSKFPEVAAERRRDRWRRIPAFVVALVRGQPDQVTMSDEEKLGEYELLMTRPPLSERQLEDYAATCAVVQSILHSLHLDGIASRWTTTDNVLKTRAFRDLIHAKKDELIVGLLMIGGGTMSTRRRRAGRACVWGEEETLIQDI